MSLALQDAEVQDILEQNDPQSWECQNGPKSISDMFPHKGDLYRCLKNGTDFYPDINNSVT